MTDLEDNSLIIYGKKFNINRFYDTIRENQAISDSGNQIIIENAVESNQIVIRIKTRYYETHVNLYQCDQVDEKFRFLISSKNFNGFIVYMDHENIDLNFFNKDANVSFDLDDSLFKLIMIDSFCSLNEKNQHRLTELSQQHNFDLLKFDEEENYIEEFKNLIYVHEWRTKSLNHSSHRATIDLLSSKVDEYRESNEQISDALSIKAEDEEQTSSNVDPNKAEELEKIFLNLRDMRDKASQMSENERKHYAENVVKTFWNAIGGDDDELSGLSDEDEK